MSEKPSYYRKGAVVYFFWFFVSGTGIAVQHEEVKNLLPKDLREAKTSYKDLVIGYEEDALRVGQLLANHYNKPVQVLEDYSGNLLDVVEPNYKTTHEAETFAEYSILAAYGTSIQTIGQLNRQEPVTVEIELAYKGLKHGFDRELLSDIGKRAYDTVVSAHTMKYTHMVVTLSKASK